MENIPIADIMTIDLLAGTDLDRADQMRVQIMAMDIEKVSRGLNIELPEEIFIDNFVNEIQETSGFRGFVSFCEVDLEGVRDLGNKAYRLLT